MAPRSSIWLASCLSVSLSNASSLCNINSAVTLYQNNLNGTDDANHIGFLMLDEFEEKDAPAVCKVFNEGLLTKSTKSGGRGLRLIHAINEFISGPKIGRCDLCGVMETVSSGPLRSCISIQAIVMFRRCQGRGVGPSQSTRDVKDNQTVGAGQVISTSVAQKCRIRH
jgi:hypothetical protein